MNKLIILVLMFSISGWGQSTKNILNKFIENLKQLHSLQAILEVEINRGETYNFIKLEYQSSGEKLYMKAPPPFSFELVSNGKRSWFFSRPNNTVYLYNPGSDKLQYKDPLQEKKELMEGVSDLKLLGKRYYGWKKVEVYEGRPLGGEKFVSKVLIWLDTDKGFLYKMESYDLHEKLVSRIEFKKYRKVNNVWLNLKTVNWSKSGKIVLKSTSEFKDPRVNSKIAPQTFEFKIPKDAKIKDLTKMIQKNQNKGKEN